MQALAPVGMNRAPMERGHSDWHAGLCRKVLVGDGGTLCLLSSPSCPACLLRLLLLLCSIDVDKFTLSLKGIVSRPELPSARATENSLPDRHAPDLACTVFSSPRARCSDSFSWSH